MKKTTLTRREFVGVATAAAATLSGCTIVPRPAVARSRMIPPGERINVATIGAGGQGSGDTIATSRVPGVNIVALCDVDERRHTRPVFQTFPGIPRFKDYRRMFDQMGKDIDAVIVATPDHTHAAAAIAAMERGKHVYCEKPLAHSIVEVRRMMAAAERYSVVTQMGNQGHSTDSIRLFCEWIQDGAIGNVHTIHAGSNAFNSGLNKLDLVRSERPAVPRELDWKLWQGPLKRRDYHPAFLPGTWRGWVPYGTGTIGDWTCHVIDPVFWALDLGAPSSIIADVKGYDFQTQGLAYPPGDVVTFKFPAKGQRGAVTVKWHSGTEKLPRPPELEPDRKPVETGAVIYGDKGTIVYGSHGAGGVRLIPETKMKAYPRPAKTIPRVKDHQSDWIEAIRLGRKAGSDFSYGGPLTEIALLGVIAIKLAGTELAWDARAMRFTNSRAANQYLQPEYRFGWNFGL
jgi:predicted dehydrogenase